MSAVDQIQAAIEKLTELRDAPFIVATFRNVDASSADWFARAEMKLAMFHRTIDAQLAILRHAIEDYSPRDDAQGFIVDDGIALARAIIGGA